MKDFLTARWSNLILLTYRVDPAILQKWLPPGCQLDSFAGTTGFVSLVAFDFLETRVMGIGWPLPRGMRDFSEINLRFYVRHTHQGASQRGVCFIREFVPSRTVAAVARWVYNEPYRAARMSSQVRTTNGDSNISHRLNWRGKEHRLEAHIGKESSIPPSESVEHFFKEHQWGYGRRRDGRLLRYEVIHPEWSIYQLKSFKLDWDWEMVYGKEWTILQNDQPFHAMVAVGSQVRVMPKA